MPEFWEATFQAKQTMWGDQPADSARATAERFHQRGLQHLLIPGFGYGRNAAAFTRLGLTVTGIEISQTAINLARRRFSDTVTIHHGSVTAMPFDEVIYDGVFCYALIHLLDAPARARLIRDCYAQLRPGGDLVFVAISTRTPAYGQGQAVAPHTYLTSHGVTIFYYDADAVNLEFGPYDLLEAQEIQEPTHPAPGQPTQTFWRITCRK